MMIRQMAVAVSLAVAMVPLAHASTITTTPMATGTPAPARQGPLTQNSIQVVPQPNFTPSQTVDRTPTTPRTSPSPNDTSIQGSQPNFTPSQQVDRTPTTPRTSPSPNDTSIQGSQPNFTPSQQVDRTPTTPRTSPSPNDTRIQGSQPNFTPSQQVDRPLEEAPLPRRKPVYRDVDFVVNLPGLNQGQMYATASVISVNGVAVAGEVQSRIFNTVTDEDGNVSLHQVRNILFSLGNFSFVPGQENSIKIQYQVNGFSKQVDGPRVRTFTVYVGDASGDIRIEVDGVPRS